MPDDVVNHVKKSLFNPENVIVGAFLSALLYLGVQQVTIKEAQAKLQVTSNYNSSVAKKVEQVLPTVERVSMKVDGVICMLQYKESNIHAKEQCLQNIINGE